MKCDPKHRMDLVADEAPLHHATDHVFLDIDEQRAGRLIATNRRALAVVPVEVDDEDVQGPISCEAFRYAIEFAGQGRDAVIRCLSTKLIMINGIQFPRPTGEDGGMFPAWRNALADDGEIHRVAFDARLLANLASALGVDRVELRFIMHDVATGKGPRRAIYVRPIPRREYEEPGIRPGTQGAIMPVATTGENP